MSVDLDYLMPDMSKSIAEGGIRFESSDPQKIGLLEQLFAFDL